MPNTSLFKPDGYESPKKTIKDFYELVSEVGVDAVLSQGKYKLDREKWVAGMACIGMHKLTGCAWFLKPSLPKEETPDFRAAAFNSIENGKYIVWREVECEIVECTKNIIFDDCLNPEQVFLDHLEKKKFNKAYPGNFVLIVYSRFRAKVSAWKNLLNFWLIDSHNFPKFGI